MNAGIQSLNFALLTSSLIVLVIHGDSCRHRRLRIARPLESMRKGRAVHERGDFSQRADEEQEGEIGDLARTINRHGRGSFGIVQAS